MENWIVHAQKGTAATQLQFPPTWEMQTGAACTDLLIIQGKLDNWIFYVNSLDF
jgi:hypothetical protein